MTNPAIRIETVEKMQYNRFMQTQDSKTQYIFLDESGKPEVYSAKGVNLVERGQATKFLVLAAVRADSQLLIL